MLIEYIWLYHYCKIINKACGMQTRFISNFVELFGTRVKNAEKFITTFTTTAEAGPSFNTQ